MMLVSFMTVSIVSVNSISLCGSVKLEVFIKLSNIRFND